MKIPNPRSLGRNFTVSLARIVSEDSQLMVVGSLGFSKSSKDS